MSLKYLVNNVVDSSIFHTSKYLMCLFGVWPRIYDMYMYVLSKGSGLKLMKGLDCYYPCQLTMTWFYALPNLTPPDSSYAIQCEAISGKSFQLHIYLIQKELVVWVKGRSQLRKSKWVFVREGLKCSELCKLNLKVTFLWPSHSILHCMNSAYTYLFVGYNTFQASP